MDQGYDATGAVQARWVSVPSHTVRSGTETDAIKHTVLGILVAVARDGWHGNAGSTHGRISAGFHTR